TYYTFVGTSVGYSADRTVRPYLTLDPDGLGLQVGNDVHGDGSSFPTVVPASAMKVDETQANCTPLSNANCAARVLKWTIGVDDGDPLSTNRWTSPSDGHLIGDIHHSTPKVVERPDAVLQDETYTTFATLKHDRPQMLYASSNDGFLHGF